MYENLKKLYNEYPYSNEIVESQDPKENLYRRGLLVHNIDNVAIPFNPNWRKIAVNLSGGADSAVSTYLLCKLIEQNGYATKVDVITHVRVWNARPWAGPISKNVFNKLKEYFPNIINQRTQNYIPPELEHGAIGPIIGDSSGDMIIVDSFNSYYSYSEKIDAIFNFTTRDPSGVPGLHAPKRNIDIDDVKLKHLAQNRSYYWFFKPFIVIEKDWIIEQYYKNNILDLLEVTRSCEADGSETDNLDYTNYTIGQEVRECGKCYWCQEKEWALEKVKTKYEF